MLMNNTHKKQHPGNTHLFLETRTHDLGITGEMLYQINNLLYLSFRPIPTKPGSTKPTNAPQRCWAVAKWSQKVLWLPFPSPLYLQKCTCAVTTVFTPPVRTCALVSPLTLYLGKCRSVSV